MQSNDRKKERKTRAALNHQRSKSRKSHRRENEISIDVKLNDDLQETFKVLRQGVEVKRIGLFSSSRNSK